MPVSGSLLSWWMLVLFSCVKPLIQKILNASTDLSLWLNVALQFKRVLRSIKRVIFIHILWTFSISGHVLKNPGYVESSPKEK